MRASYSIFSVSGYVLESIRGSATAADLFGFASRRQRDPRVLAHYHTLTDYSRAKPRLSATEVEALTNILYESRSSSGGRHALVVSGARSFVFATVFQACSARVGVESQCFGHRDAALSWLLADAHVPARAEAVDHSISSIR